MRQRRRAVKILPTEDGIGSDVGSPLSTFGFQPFVGGVEILPDGYRSDAEAAPISRAAVTDTAPRIVYEPLPVVEAARQSYFNWDESFTRQWQQCSDTTVVEVSLAVTPAGRRQADPRIWAVRIAQTMLGKSE